MGHPIHGFVKRSHLEIFNINFEMVLDFRIKNKEEITSKIEITKFALSSPLIIKGASLKALCELICRK